jgi:hypothetical protein
MKKLLVIGSTLALLVLAGTALAAPGGGATVDDSSYCVTTPFTTICYDIHTVTNTTTTPSGNVSYVTNGAVTANHTFPFSTCTYSRTEPLHLHHLVKDGDVHSESWRLDVTTDYQCGTFGQSCTTEMSYHYANGATQFGRYETVCETTF